MDKFKVFDEFALTEDFEISTVLTEKKITLKEGDKLRVGTKWVKILSGEGRGKLLPNHMAGFEVEGINTEKMCQYLLQQLKREFSFDEHIEGYDLDEKQIIEFMEECLDDYL